MALDFTKLSPEELLAAESAVLTMRSLLEAAKTAPHGQGMFHVESVLQENGFEHLRKMLETAVASHEGAQKKGSAVFHVPAEKPPRSNAGRKRPF
jgi:hypothetical protein